MTNNKSTLAGKMTQYRWIICAMLFFATTVNYLDRQVLSLTWDEFIKPEFHWNEYHYGLITSIFSIVYAVCMLFAGRFIDWMGTKKGYLWAIGVWSMGACMHALCGIATEAWVGLPDAAALRARRGRVGPGRDHRHGQHVFLHRRALHPRPGRGGQLPGSHQGDPPSTSPRRTAPTPPRSSMPALRSARCSPR